MWICKKIWSSLCSSLCSRRLTLKDYEYSCQIGDINLYRKTQQKLSPNEFIGLEIAIEYNNKNIVEAILQNNNFESKELDPFLIHACKKNLYDISEMLVIKGANPKKGIANTKSPIIIAMLYKY